MRTRLAPFGSLVQPAPIAVYAYIDKLGCWLRDPLRSSDLARLRQHCEWLKHWEEEASFDPDLQQRLQLYQPKPRALELLARRNDVHFNYLENSLDWIFRTEGENDDAHAYLDHHLIKNCHRQQGIRYVGGTRYSGPRRASNVLVVYSDRECRLTGVTPCTHIEWRLRGSAALGQAGLGSIRDLLTLDHYEFWRHRLVLLGVNDLALLGRRHNNHFWGTKRRQDWIEVSSSLSWNQDARLGRIIYEICDRSVQQLVDRFGPKFAIRSCLTRLPVEGLLPQPHSLL
jgi:hypothetical protein